LGREFRNKANGINHRTVNAILVFLKRKEIQKLTKYGYSVNVRIEWQRFCSIKFTVIATGESCSPVIRGKNEAYLNYMATPLTTL